MWFRCRVASPRTLAQARRAADQLHRTLAGEVVRLRTDAIMNRARLAREAGVDSGYLARIEEGNEHPSLETYARLGIVLGADLGAHLYPNTGPTIRDRHQGRIQEGLLELLHPRWRPFPEVAVRHPARGWIDVLLHEPREQCVVATEIESGLGRIEQKLRWAADKTESLSSWAGYAHLGPIATTSRLLIVRSTRATRTIGREFARQLEAAYPAHPEDALAALTGTKPWPGPALVWARIDADGVRFEGQRVDATRAIIRTT